MVLPFVSKISRNKDLDKLGVLCDRQAEEALALLVGLPQHLDLLELHLDLSQTIHRHTRLRHAQVKTMDEIQDQTVKMQSNAVKLRSNLQPRHGWS